VESAGAELKPGERKIISNGSDGPIVEIIKRSSPATSPDTSPETLFGTEREIPDKITEA